MTGKLCLHPNQIASVNTEFSPCPELIEWANTTLHQLGDAQTVTDGSQLPRIARAHKIIALAQHYGEIPEPVQHHHQQKTTNGLSGQPNPRL
ncbi:hypothetical protein [Rhodococcus jostii]|nr:hypothetical protein [Rhodococcus jostii]